MLEKDADERENDASGADHQKDEEMLDRVKILESGLRKKLAELKMVNPCKGCNGAHKA